MTPNEVTVSPLKWAGGKRKLVPQLAPLRALRIQMPLSIVDVIAARSIVPSRPVDASGRP